MRENALMKTAKGFLARFTSRSPHGTFESFSIAAER
jgi:hypothetical protein